MTDSAVRSERCDICSMCPPGLPCRRDCHICWPGTAALDPNVDDRRDCMEAELGDAS